MHVRVAVEQPGQHGGAGAVDQLVAVQAGADLDDPAVLDHHVGAGRGGAGPVEDLSVREEGAHGTYPIMVDFRRGAGDRDAGDHAGLEDAFAAAYGQVKHEVAGAPGCRSMRLVRGIESPSRFVLMVEWESVEAHERGFRATERFGRWRAASAGTSRSAPQVEHYQDVASP